MTLDRRNFLELIYSMPYVFIYKDGIDFIGASIKEKRTPDLKAVTFPFKGDGTLGARCAFLGGEVYKRLASLKAQDIHVGYLLKNDRYFLTINDVKIQTAPTSYKVF